MNNPAPAEIETALLGMCRQALPGSDIAPADDFFAAGGNSVTSMLLIKNIQDAYGVRVPPGRFYAHPTMAALATVVAEQLAAGRERA
ncbi:acyl carrier protein [Nonomuraea typhae]|uniref:Acyl carrier protein n=1 Tax=Nonomuraea typhae TaxID=2603600 RepID=A0ABW7ZA01_9ACTN